MARWEAEEIIRAITGGLSPNDGDILFFDKSVGWRFIPVSGLEITVDQIVETTENGSGGSGGSSSGSSPVLTVAQVAARVRISG